MSTEDSALNSSKLKKQLEEALREHTNYYKLLSFKIVAKFVTQSVRMLIVASVSLFALLFLAFSGAFALGAYWGNYAYGFLAVSGGLLLLLFLFLLVAKQIVDRPVLRKLSELFSKEIK